MIRSFCLGRVIQEKQASDPPSDGLSRLMGVLRFPLGFLEGANVDLLLVHEK
jgi:hypothetical protein